MRRRVTEPRTGLPATSISPASSAPGGTTPEPAEVLGLVPDAILVLASLLLRYPSFTS
jgi:hypothetical protein